MAKSCTVDQTNFPYLDKEQFNLLEKGNQFLALFGENFILNANEINEANVKQYLNIMEALVGDLALNSILENAIYPMLDKKQDSLGGKSALDLFHTNKAYIALNGDKVTNYTKLKIFKEGILNAINKQFFLTDVGKNAGYAKYVPTLAAINPYSVNYKDGEYIPDNNSASLYGVRPFKASLSKLGSNHQGEQKFLSVYQALVYHFALTKGAGDSDPRLAEILKTSDRSKLESILNDILGSDGITASVQLADTIAYLINNSFNVATSINPKNLKQAVKTLKSIKTISETGDNILLSIYNQSLNKIKDNLDESAYNFKKSISSSKDITLDNILANPDKLYFISINEPLAKEIEEYNSRNTQPIENVKIINPSENVENKLTRTFYYKDAEGRPKSMSKTQVDNLIHTYDSSSSNEGSTVITHDNNKTQTTVQHLKEYIKKGQTPDTINFELKDKELYQIKEYIQTLIELAEKNPHREFRFAFEIKNFGKTIVKNFTGEDLVNIITEVFDERFKENKIIPSNFKLSKQIKDSGLLGKEQYKEEIDTYIRGIQKYENDVIISDSLMQNQIDISDIDIHDYSKKVLYAQYLYDTLNKVLGKQVSITSNDIYRQLEYKENENLRREINTILFGNKKENLARFTEEQNQKKIKLSDHIPSELLIALPEANTNVELFGNQEAKNPVNEIDFLKAFGVFYDSHRRNNYDSMNFTYKVKGHIEREGKWTERPIDNSTLAVLYIPKKSEFKNVEQYEGAIKQALVNAELILKKGGRIITLAGSKLRKANSALNRFEEGNKIIYNELIKRGYNFEKNTRYEGINIWKANTSKIESERKAFEEKHKFLEEHLAEIKEFKSSVKQYDQNNTSVVEIVVSNNMFSSIEESLKKGSVTFDANDELYESVKEAIENFTNYPNTTLKFLLADKFYYITLNTILLLDDISFSTNSIDINLNKSLGQKFSVQRILEFEEDVNSALFDNMATQTNDVAFKNPYIVLGEKKADEYLTLLLNNARKSVDGIVLSYKNDLIERRKAINKEISELINNFQEGKEFNTEKHEQLKKEKQRINLDLKDIEDGKVAKALITFEQNGYKGINALFDSMFLDLNNREISLDYLDCDTKAMTLNGQSITEDELNELKANYYAALDDLYNKLSAYVNLDALNISEEDKEAKKTDLYKKAEEFLWKSREAYKDIIDNKELLMPVLLKRIGRAFHLNINPNKGSYDIENAGEIVQNSQSEEDNIEDIADDREGNENINADDSESNVSDGESNSKEAYQMKNEDIAKSLSATVKEVFLSDIAKQSNDPTFNYCEVSYFGEILCEDTDDVYKFLREKLQGCHTYSEMLDRVKDLIEVQGYKNYDALYKKLVSWRDDYPDLTSQFFCAMCTQFINRVSDVFNSSKSNYVIDDTKDTRFEYLMNQTKMNIDSKQALNDDDYNVIGKTDEELTNVINRLQPFRDDICNGILKQIRAFNRLKVASLNKEGEEQMRNFTDSDFLHSTKAEDVEYLNKWYANTTTYLRAFGIPITEDYLRKYLSSEDKVKNFANIVKKANQFFGGGMYSLKGGGYLGFLNLCRFLGPALDFIPQSQMTYANGKTYANYQYPSYSSIMYDRLNDNSKNPETGVRRNKEYIEERFKKYPIFYKANNIDEIYDFLIEYQKANPEWIPDKYLQLIMAVGKSNGDEKTRKFLTYATSVLNYNERDFEDYDNSDDMIKSVVLEDKETMDNITKALPPMCPKLKFDIWASPILEQYYKYGKPNANNTDSERFANIQTKIMNKVRGKEIGDLSEQEYTQFCIDSFFNTYEASNEQFGLFFSPVVSDAEVARMELLPAMGYNKVIETFVNITKAEKEMQDALMQKFINRLCSYYRYNQKIKEYNESKAKGGNPVKPKLSNQKGYTEFERDVDITEVEWSYNEDGTIPLNDLKFKVEGDEVTLDISDNANSEAVQERIDKLNSCKYNYIYWDREEGAPSLEQQVKTELNRQFHLWLQDLIENHRDLTIPHTIRGKGSKNIRVFKKTPKSFDEFLETFEEDMMFDSFEIASNNEKKEDIDLDNYTEELAAEQKEQVKEKDSIEESIQSKPEYTNIRNQFVKYGSFDTYKELQNYFLLQAAATVQLHQMYNTSVGFYPNPIAHQKRGKEHNTPLKRLDVEAITKVFGEEAANQKIIYLRDLEIDSNLNDIIDIIRNSKNLSDIEKDTLISAYENMDITDGQAMRTLKSWKKIRVGLGEWNDEKEDAYQRLLDPNVPIDFADVRTLTVSPEKGFGFYMEDVQLTPSYSVKKPVQLKDSEAVLFWALAKTRNKDNTVLQGLTEFMEENDIDCAIFDSGIKVNGSGVIDLTSAKTSEDAKYILTHKMFKDENNTEINDRVLHSLSWAEYGIASATPEHFFEAKARFGNQIRRALVGDLQLNKIYEYQDMFTSKIVKKTGEQIIADYSKLIKESLNIDFNTLKSMFNDPAKLEDYLLKEVTSNPSYPTNLTESVIYNRLNGNFDKLGNPKKYAKIQQLLLALIKNRITAQKVAGGSLVQTSVMYDYENLKIKFNTLKDESGNIIYDEDGNPKKYLSYAECYLPAYMRELYEDFTNADGIVDINKMKKKLDKKTFTALTNMIGYRIPTEGLSSALKLRVKGFLNGYEGNTIILPKEIVTLSGSDFDIDKMFIHRFSFKRDKRGNITLITRKNAKGEKEMKEAINNELIQEMLQIMTIPENTLHCIRPQGFANLKRSKMIISILKSPDNKLSVSQLRNMKDKELKKLYKEKGLNFSYINPSTQAYFIRQNMVGKKLLGIWAVAKSAHSLFENSGLVLKDDYRFSYNGTSFERPDPVTINIGGIEKYVSAELGSYLGASADNAKDPVLFFIGINNDNINIACYLARLGVDSTSLAIMLNNRWFAKYKEREAYLTLNHNKLLGSISEGMEKEIMWDDNIFLEAQDINSDRKIKVRLNNGTYIEIEEYALCYYIAKFLDSTIKPAADQLNELTTATREDSVNGTVKSTMAATMSEMQQKEQAERMLYDERSCFVQTSDKPFFTTNFDMNDPSTDITTNSIFVQDFANMGFFSIRQLFKGKLPHFGAAFQQAFEIGRITQKGYISKYNAKKLEQALYYYHFSKLPIFGNEEIVNKDGSVSFASFAGKVYYYKKDFPGYLNNFLAAHPELMNNWFMRYITIDRKLNEDEENAGKIRVVRFPNANLLDDTERNKVSVGFSMLINSDDPEIKKIAWHLVRYSFYRQGFQFLPDGFAHLIPDEVYEAIPGYSEMVANLIKTSEQDGALVNNWTFIEDFILNNESMIKSLNTISSRDKSLFSNDRIFLQNSLTTNLINVNAFKKRFGYIPPYLCFRTWDKNNNRPVFKLLRYSRGTYSSIGNAETNNYFIQYRQFAKEEPVHLVSGKYVKEDIFNGTMSQKDYVGRVIKGTDEAIEKSLKTVRQLSKKPKLTDEEASTLEQTKRIILRRRYGISLLKELLEKDELTEQEVSNLISSINNIDINDPTVFEMLLNFDYKDNQGNTLYGLNDKSVTPDSTIETNCQI